MSPRARTQHEPKARALGPTELRVLACVVDAGEAVCILEIDGANVAAFAAVNALVTMCYVVRIKGYVRAAPLGVAEIARVRATRGMWLVPDHNPDARDVRRRVDCADLRKCEHAWIMQDSKRITVSNARCPERCPGWRQLERVPVSVGIPSTLAGV